VKLPVVATTDPITILVINEIHPSLNVWSRWHWTQVRRESERWHWFVRQARSAVQSYAPYVRPVIVTVTYFFPTRARHDFDNYAPKFILDGLKGVLIPDDNSEIIEELRIRFRYDKAHPRTEITLHPT